MIYTFSIFRLACIKFKSKKFDDKQRPSRTDGSAVVLQRHPVVRRGSSLCSVGKMATGLLQRVGGLARAKSRALPAGQHVLWCRWGGLQCTGSLLISVDFEVGCRVFLSVGLCCGYGEWGLASPLTASPLTASQSPVAFSFNLHRSCTLQ